MKANRLFIACVSTLALTACGGSTELTATMNSAAERPAPTTASNATGTVTVTVDGNKLEVSGNFSGLTGNHAGVHIHGPAADDNSTAPIFCNLGAPTGTSGNLTAGEGTGSCADKVLTDAEVKDFEDGKMYVNIHTTANGQGEIRGNLKKKE
jgi:hypothetical protein